LTRGYRIRHPPLLEIAKKYKRSAAQILIRWGLQHGYVEIPKSGRQERIKENANVWDFEIEEVDMKKLDDMDEYLVTSNTFLCLDSLFQAGTQLEHLEI
jgi:diketogulonate reductase-like aldo/keto reductase